MTELFKEQVKATCLEWTAEDVAYKVDDWVHMENDKGIDLDTTLEITEQHREYLQGIMRDAVLEHHERICETIGDALWDYMIENKTDIMEFLTRTKYLI